MRPCHRSHRAHQASARLSHRRRPPVSEIDVSAAVGPRIEAGPTTTSTGTPAVAGLPLRILRSEGVILFAAALAAYFSGLDEPWWLVPLLLLAPDVFMAGYAASHRVGAALYNLAHSYMAPAVLGAVAIAADEPLWQGVALIWFAHIGMDRALGYGLKYDTGFKDTHLGRIGR